MSGTKMMSTLETLQAERSSRTVVARKPDGTAEIVRSLAGGRVTYVVTGRLVDGKETTLIATTHDDVAAVVFDAFDGRSRPWHALYQPRGFNSREAVGEHSKQVWVFAVGATARDAVLAFADSLGTPGDAVQIHHLEERDGDWDSRFSLNGTSMKAGGRLVPGGYVVTDWK